MLILQFTDVSSRIKCDFLTGEQQMLQSINAQVSHEMRNPINSILCQNLMLQELSKELDTIIENLEPKNVEESKVLLKQLGNKILSSIEIQSSSTKMLKYFVNDMLTLAQIREGKFRKECSNFDIRVAINEIMLFQRQKAESMQINFTCLFKGFN